MKKIAIFLAIALAATACKKDKKDIGQPFSQTQGLTQSTWTFSSASLIDEYNPAQPQKDITSFYTQGTPLTLTFNSDGSFTSNAGSGKNPFPADGTWAFDDPSAPSKIIITSNGSTTDLLLGSPTRVSDKYLNIKFVTKYCEVSGNTKPAVGYNFQFVRSN